MNRNDARKIAETITNEQLKTMFDNAKSKITDWTKVATANKGLTKGTAWNILAKDFDINKTHHILSKKNMVWEFGDYLPEELKIKRQKTIRSIPPVHQEPIFNNFECRVCRIKDQSKKIGTQDICTDCWEPRM